jgi:uncharacterized protein YecE (DUF72 family)
VSTIRIGISGWRYPPWRGVFYPKDLAQRRELEFASRVLPSIEINGSFYSLQRPANYERWYQETPANFIFSIKGGRYITHMLKLRGVERALANFFASGVLALRDKMGPFLWQLPPVLRYDVPVLERFLASLPRDSEAALELARRHDQRMVGRAWLQIDRNRKLRHALEIRHESFIDRSFVRLLRRQNVALVIADTAGKWPYREDITADFVYMRLHGDTQLYVSGYSKPALSIWADRIRAWSTGEEPADARRIADIPARKRDSRDVYCYFDNDAKVHAPFDAYTLNELLGLSWAPSEPAAKTPARPPRLPASSPPA